MQSISLTFFSSVLHTSADIPRLRFCLVSFLVKMWRLKACFLLSLPVPVTQNLFLALELVFIFGMTVYIKV